MRSPDETASSLCGLWVDAAGMAHITECGPDGGRDVREAHFPPFCWTAQNPPIGPGQRAETLKGAGAFEHLRFFETAGGLGDFVKEHGANNGALWIRSLEGQFLMEEGRRLFEGMHFAQLRRMQVDIETHSQIPGAFPDPRNAQDRVLAIGLRDGRGNIFLTVEALTDAAERKLLEEFNTHLQAFDPDVIEGHNLFKFDLDFLRQRCKRLKVPCAWGRYGQLATFRNSRLKIAERQLDFPRCDLPGRTVFDTYLALQMYDISNRDLPSYSLKNAAVYFGFTKAADARTYLAPADIQRTFFEDRKTFLAYLGDDLRETAALAGFLLPAYFAQAKNLPMSLQEICLRGNAQKIETLFLERYLTARQALPPPPAVEMIEGGYTQGLKTGVFKNVLHFDVASLYPSLLLAIGRNPASDTLGVFIPLLTQLRADRLEYKRLARTAPSALRDEYTARQASFKILINSFYGYLAFGGARFADSDLAAEVTRRGRALLQALIAEFENMGLPVLEADTDGLYVDGKDWFEKPEKLLEKVEHVLPEGIDLEFDGAYPAMWCYKAKNYALYDGQHVILRGSALRSRSMEPFLKKLNDTLIAALLGASAEDVCALLIKTRAQLAEGTLPVAELAKTEFLSMNPAVYAREVEKGKVRRASLEVALRMTPVPKQGERVRYYVTKGEKARTPDWQVARPLEDFDAQKAPYDAAYYLRKLDEWQKRYAEFLPGDCAPPERQGELL